MPNFLELRIFNGLAETDDLTVRIFDNPLVRFSRVFKALRYVRAVRLRSVCKEFRQNTVLVGIR